MACQGCGRISETRLCCPTCIEYGRTSFFCDQECFMKNWNAHSQLHEMLRRKKAMGSGGGDSCPPAGSPESVEVSPGPPADGSGGAGGAGRGSVSGTSGGSFGGSSSSTSGGLAPLAGGTSIVNLTVQKRNTGGGKTAGAGAGVGPAGAGGVSAAGAGPGVFGSIMGQARTMFGEAGAAAAFKNRLGGQRARPRSPSPPTRTKAAPRGRERSGSGDRGRLASGQPVAPRRSFNVQLGLWGLVVVCATAGMLFYREHERYLDNPSTQGQIGGVAGGPNTMSSVAAVVPPPRPTKKSASADVVAAPAAAVAVVAAAPAADAAASGLAAVAPQSEIQALRAMVDRHEQMLRYIMGRYAEKTSDGKPAEGVPGIDVHEAVPVDMTRPEFESKSFEETAAEKAAPRGNPSLRKRHGGDDAVGIPTLER